MKQSLILTYANAYGRKREGIGIVWNQNAEGMGAKIQEDADHNITFSFFHIYLPNLDFGIYFFMLSRLVF